MPPKHIDVVMGYMLNYILSKEIYLFGYGTICILVTLTRRLIWGFVWELQVAYNTLECVYATRDHLYTGLRT